MKEENAPDVKVIGISMRTRNSDEAVPDTARIPGLWQQFFSDNIEVNIPSKVDDGCLYGVYTHYDSDHKGEYTIYVGHEVQNLQSVPAGMNGIEIPAGKYLVFSQEGQMPGIVYTLWNNIWQFFAESKQYKRAYTLDFERYCKDNASKLDIFIAIE